MEKDEVMLLKCWDSRGRDFKPEGTAEEVPATFSLHGSFEEVASDSDAKDRESIEAQQTVIAFRKQSNKSPTLGTLGGLLRLRGGTDRLGENTGVSICVCLPQD
ncbi:unnamed protein product [Symbiodinium microadriaticum]|nr:unnamed protein product [Symbiodinium microadriaticum]